MPRYYIDIDGGDRPVHDSVGSEHTCHNTARDQAIFAVTTLAQSALAKSEIGDLMVKITSESGQPIYEALLSFRGGWIGTVP